MKLLDGFWDSEHIPAHRRGITDFEWCELQPTGSPNYYVGDVVLFKEGGYGVIVEAVKPHDGWPSSYSTRAIEGKEDHPSKKCAWFYELDFERLVAESPLRKL